MTHSIFYTNDRFREREEPLKTLLLELGFDKVIPYRREWLEGTDFYLENREILDVPKGDGCWLWKPHIILETMKAIKEGDIVFYTDAGDDIRNKDILSIIKNHMADNDYMVSGRVARPTNKRWTKNDCFILMGCNKEKYWYAPQAEAGTLVFKKTPAMIDFLNEWLAYCKNKNIITDIPDVHSKKNNGFIDHRADQSVLSLLTVKYKMPHSEELYLCINHNTFTP